MYSNQNPPLYTTRHYIHDPQSNSRNTNYNNNNNPSYDRSRPPAQPYPYYTNNQPPTTVTYINDRSNYTQQQPVSYIPPNTNRYPSTNTPVRNNSTGPAGGGGGIEKTNMMSNGSPFIDPARPHEQYNTPRTVTSITSQPKSGEFNKTLNLSDESPFHNIYGGYHYPSQIDPAKRITTQHAAVRSTDNKSLNLSDESPFFSTYGGYHYPSQIDPAKRITTQNTAVRSTENKSLNLSDESPFFSTYGRYHYPSQIDPQKRITEIPKAAAPLMATNEMSNENPFNNYQPPSYQDYPRGGNGSNTDWNRNNNPAPLSYRPIQVQRPPDNYHNQQQSSSFRPPSPPSPPPPARVQTQKPNSTAPLDKTSLNMSPDNPFAATYNQYNYPSPEEIKAQKRANERNTRFQEQQQQQPVNNTNNNRPVQPSNQMTEFPESEQKEVTQGKGNTKFTRFDVNF
jgi:hypothetical protein